MFSKSTSSVLQFSLYFSVSVQLKYEMLAKVSKTCRQFSNTWPLLFFSPK